MPHICTPSHRTAWVLFAACALLPMGAQAQTAPLNDTGQTQCYEPSDIGVPAIATCSLATGSQDARHGRDAAQTVGVLTKIGGGAAGFDFTALDANGAVTTNLGNHTCVYDNVTGLLWFRASFSMDWNSAMATYPSNGSNTTAPLCNRTGWRLPTRRELLSIVHNGVASNVQIDTTYFPDTHLGRYWTADTRFGVPDYAWSASFKNDSHDRLSDGSIDPVSKKTETQYVRLVRKGL